MRIVGRTHSRTYPPKLYISSCAFGAQDFNVTAFAPAALRLIRPKSQQIGRDCLLAKQKLTEKLR